MTELLETYTTTPLDQLIDESIFIIRETVASFKSPVMLFSAGKDSIVMATLAQKAFAPYPVPFPLLHVDTGFKFPEMYQFREEFAKKHHFTLHIFQNTEAINRNINPATFGTTACCGALKTEALLQALEHFGHDAAFGGARREEEKSRAKERVMSLRNSMGTWLPEQQRPEFWDLYNTKLAPQESMRIFPLSNWTELDVWRYIKQQSLDVPSLYFAKKRPVHKQATTLLATMEQSNPNTQNATTDIMCRFRTLGCYPCTGAILSTAQNIDDIIQELLETKMSERQNRLIDQHNGMEDKKAQGYF